MCRMFLPLREYTVEVLFYLILSPPPQHAHLPFDRVLNQRMRGQSSTLAISNSSFPGVRFVPRVDKVNKSSGPRKFLERVCKDILNDEITHECHGHVIDGARLRCIATRASRTWRRVVLGSYRRTRGGSKTNTFGETSTARWRQTSWLGVTNMLKMWSLLRLGRRRGGRLRLLRPRPPSI